MAGEKHRASVALAQAAEDELHVLAHFDLLDGIAAKAIARGVDNHEVWPQLRARGVQLPVELGLKGLLLVVGAKQVVLAHAADEVSVVQIGDVGGKRAADVELSAVKF